MLYLTGRHIMNNKSEKKLYETFDSHSIRIIQCRRPWYNSIGQSPIHFQYSNGYCYRRIFDIALLIRLVEHLLNEKHVLKMIIYIQDVHSSCSHTENREWKGDTWRGRGDRITLAYQPDTLKYNIISGIRFHWVFLFFASITKTTTFILIVSNI